MSDKINAFFQLLEGRFGLLPTSVATIALVIVLVLALLLLYSLLKLRSARQVIHQFGERLGYDPPYGDGLEILHEEIGKDILLRGKEVKIEQQAIRIGELEAEGKRKDADLSALQRRSTELEDQLQQSSLRSDAVTALTNEQAQVYRTSAEELEQRIQDMDTEYTASLTALQRRSKELEVLLQQASIQNERLTAQAGEQAQAHRIAVEKLEQRMRQMEAEGSAYLATVEQRAKEFEDQLQQASLQHEELLAQAGEQERAHQTAVEQFEERTREMEAEGIANLTALRQRFNDLEDQLRQASVRNDELAAQAGEQELSYRIAVEQLEQRIREMEAGSDANLSAVQQRSRELEEQLQQASLRNDEIAAHAGDQEQAHRIAVEQLEHRIREMEAGSDANLSGLQQRTRELEEQLQQASQRNDELAAYAGEREQAHRIAIDQLEQRIREMEAGSNDNLSGLQQRSRELEEQLQQAATLIENEKSIAHQEALERSADAERLELRIRDLEAETGIEESRATTLELQIKELEEQLRQAADRRALETAETAKTEVAPTEVANGDVSLSTSETFLRRAEWITARAVGEIVPYGLVAAESYASAALAANPQGIDAPQLLAELARIRRAYPEGLPSVIEAVTSFDERAATFFAADLARAADLADDEAQRRYRAGLNRSALLVVNIAIELRRQTAEENSPAMLRLLETKASLLARLGSNARASNGAPELTSQ